MQAACGVVVVARVSEITIKVAAKLGSYSIRAIVVSGVEGAGGTRKFTDAAEVVAGVVVEAGIAAAKSLLAFVVVAF